MRKPAIGDRVEIPDERGEWVPVTVTVLLSTQFSYRTDEGRDGIEFYSEYRPCKGSE